MLKIDSLTKSFGDKNVLTSFSAEIKTGEPILITGTSGSGKTTLLRIIAGLESADSGQVLFSDGSTVSFMFQEPRLFPWMNVLDNTLTSLGRNTSVKAKEILTSLGLGDEFTSYPAELSGGMQRRVAIARALLFPADVYLFDEPFAGLDRVCAENAASIILEYTKGKIVIIVSHETGMLPPDIRTIKMN